MRPSDDKTLDAYVDGELGVEVTLEVEARLEGDTVAAEQVARLRALRQRVVEACDDALPGDLERRLRQKIASASRVEAARVPPAAPRGFSWAWTASAAVLILALSLPSWLSPPPPAAGALAEIEKYHGMFVSHGAPEHEEDLSGATHKLNRQFQTDYRDTSLVMPAGEFRGWCNLRLKGIQDARRFAYEVDGQLVSLYILRSDQDIPCPLLKDEVRSGDRLYLSGLCGPYHVVRWQQGALAYILVADLPQDRLVEVMDTLSF